MGHVFESAEEAKTIRSRNGVVQVTDGPVTRADEPIAGFNLLECDSLEEALRFPSGIRWQSMAASNCERSPHDPTNL
jgi:hypothetical protein